MPIFTRRRLQLMLDDLSALADASKLTDLVRRLENKRVEQALPAEMELAVLWALSKLGEVEVEPDWYGKGVPEAYTEHLFEGYACVVEVTALSDGRLSQESEMRAAAARLSEEANRIRKGQGKHLYFEFVEESGFADGKRFRRRKLERDFTPSSATINQLRSWLIAEGVRPPLRVVQAGTDFVITWGPHARSPHSNFFSSMPAEAYSLEDNPLYDALREKAAQLASPEFDGLRCVVLADVGAHLLMHSSKSSRSPGTVNGQEVIEHFLQNATTVDVVLLLSPHRTRGAFGHQFSKLEWLAKAWTRPGIELDTSGVSQMVSFLPAPRFEGYQARSLQQQAAYRYDANGWYVGWKCESGASKMTISISARAVLDLLAGRITSEKFQHRTGLEGKNRSNLFKHRLEQGDILSGARLEPGGVDEDDDWLVFELARDPSASPLVSSRNFAAPSPTTPEAGRDG